MFPKTFKASRRRVTERINKRDFCGIGFALGRTQMVRKILAKIFEKPIRE